VVHRSTHAFRYWDVRIKRKGKRDIHDGVLNYYITRSNVNVETFDKILSLSECHHQESNMRVKLKDVVSEAKQYGTTYELEVVTARVHKRHTELFDNPALDLEREDHIAKELKSRDNRRTAARSYQKLGRQI
jgi:hypothetical protein